MCTSANFLSSRALVKTFFHWLSIFVHQSKSVSFHWLLRFSALVVNYSIWVTSHGVATFKGTCLSKGRLFTDWYRYRIESHLLVYRRRKVLVYWKRLEARSTVRVPCVDRNLWKAAKVSTEPSREVKQSRMFSAMADEATDVSNKEIKTFSCPPLCRLFKEYSRAVFWCTPLLRRNNR